MALRYFQRHFGFAPRELTLIANSALRSWDEAQSQDSWPHGKRTFHGKTHFPSDLLVGEVLNNPETTRDLTLSRDQIGFLLAMADNAASIEKQRSMPRYGWETRDRIIKPSEIYDEEKASEIMSRSKTIQAAAHDFYSTLVAKELESVLGKVDLCLKR